MTGGEAIENLGGLRDFLRNHLLGCVVPFWLRNTIDGDGGINTCVRDDGTLVSRDKWLWSQWRAVWVFCRLYRHVTPDPRWLDIAWQIYRYCVRFGWDADYGGWRLRLSHDGSALAGCQSIYVDAFAIYALAELARVTGEAEVLRHACVTADAVLRRLQLPHDQIAHFPYPIPPGARVHGIPMMFSLCLWKLGRLTGEARYLDAAAAMSDDIFTHFYRPDRNVVLERLAADNREYPPSLGTAVVPGHVIEDMWFQMDIARDQQNRSRLDLACQLILRHLELAWDRSFGGLLLAIDADGRPEVGWSFADTKLWWPHTEAMIATLFAYEHTGDRRFLEWYAKVHDYSFQHYPVVPHGEWTQRLDRQGNRLEATVALPVKDPFHLPRALMHCLDVLDRLLTA